MARALVLIASFLLLAGLGRATTLFVPSSEYPTIQSAINVALTGDTVLVADGLYVGAGNRDIDANGKDIVLRSENGPEATIIDCQGSEIQPRR